MLYLAFVLEYMQNSQSTLGQSRAEECGGSLLETTTNLHANFSFPEAALDEGMSRYQREARDRLELSRIVHEISETVHEIINLLLHEKIYSQITRIINELLCIRQEVPIFSKEGSLKQEQINYTFNNELNKTRHKIDEISARNFTNFSSFLNHSTRQFSSSRSKIVPQDKPSDDIKGLANDVYDFMHKKQASKLFKECDEKLSRLEEQLKQETITLSNKIEQVKKKQKPVNENLRIQLNDALSKDLIGKQVKRTIKQHIRYLFDELVRSRKDIDQLKDELKELNNRQRELQFSQTLLQHKIG